MEEEIIRQLENLEKDAVLEIGEILGVFLKIEREFVGILKEADKIDLDRESYPEINAAKIFTPAPSAQPNPDTSLAAMCALWMVYALLEKSAQYYQQASLNSAHPVLKIFFSSLSEIKNILRRRAAAQVRIVSNDLWGKVGFAPFILGKD
jgi:hypothetical protein